MSSNQERGAVTGASSSNYSEWNIDVNWFLKSGNLVKWWKQEREDPWVGNRSPSQCTDKFVIDDDDMDADTDTESDFSCKSRSFLHRVNDRLPKIFDQSSKDAMQDTDKVFMHLYLLERVYLNIFLFLKKQGTISL